jgi:hypothetical protein
VSANQAAACYDVFVAEGRIPDPVWPDMRFKDILKVAFGNRVISSIDHPVIQHLHGKF